MTNQNSSGNGSRLSLENCLTNIFALTDLAGIRWRRLRSQVGSNLDVLDDPVLSSYAKCLKADMLCSWARVPVSSQNDTPQPNTFMEYSKELWVFWYGDAPTSLQTYLASELQETEQGSWETTLLSYECRTFLFKALHNVIERCLLAKQFVRIGKWFVQPQGDADSDVKCSPLSFSFQNFFLHGESTVCVSVDVEKRAQLYKLTSQQLKLANEGQSNLGSAPSSAPVLNSVILAPYGLAGVLTGRPVSPADQSIADWQQFYPLSNNVAQSNGDLPAMVEVAVGGVRMKYPSAFIVTTSAPIPKENKPRSVQPERCEKCMTVLVAKTTTDSMQSAKREEDNSSWSLGGESYGRTSCNCVKSKSAKQKLLKQGSPVSPKLEGKRSRTVFHRRSPPIEKLLTSQGLKNAPPQSNAGNVPSGSSNRSNSGTTDSSTPISTPQMSVKEDLSSPTLFPQPSPLRTPRTPKTPVSNLTTDKLNSRSPSIKAPPSVEDSSVNRSLQQAPFSVGSSRTPQTPQAAHPASTSQGASTSQDEGGILSVPLMPTSYVGSQVERMHSQHTSPVKDLTKRPCLPNGPTDNDELSTDSFYTFASFQAWLDLPLKKRFKHEPVSHTTPQGYEKLSHPLAKHAIKPERQNPTAITKTYFLSTPKPDTAASAHMFVIKAEPNEPSEPALPSLMTSDALKPQLSDLDKMFDSEDEGTDDRLGNSNGHNTGAAISQRHTAASGGLSMASAHAVGPVTAADLAQIYPTPPSHDNHNTAFSPADHLHQNHQDSADFVDIPEPTAAIYRTANMAKYLSVNEYKPLELPSSQLPIEIPTECRYKPWANNKFAPLMPLNSVENLPCTLNSMQPASVRSNMSPGAAGFYPPGRTPLGLGSVDMLQSPGSVLSLPPKSVAGLSSVENPSTHGVASTFNAHMLPDAQSLLVNMSLSDSMLNLYKDQNFESCNLCVCNMNILGNDLGLYLPTENCEEQYKCSCGFSAVTNRHNGFCSGLFYEDECEIMRHRDDRFDKLKLKPLTEKSPQEVNRVLLNQLRDQFLTAAPSLLTRYTVFSQHVVSNSDKKSEFERQDVCSVIMSALNTGQYINYDNMNLSRTQSPSQCWSRWSLERASKEPLPSIQIIQLLRSLQPALQDAVQKKRTTSLWDPNAIKVTGPMTWQSFFKLAGRSTDELMEPQPVPPLLVGSEDDWLRQSPFALQHWDKLMLKPFGGERNISYVVVAPDNDLVNKCCKRFFHDFSQLYGQCQLGKHMPYQGQRDGILRVGKHLASTVSEKSTSDWFNKLDSMSFGQRMKLIAKVCKHYLAPLLSNKIPDITSPLPPSSHSMAHEGVFTKPNHPAGSTTPTSAPPPSVFSPPPRDETTAKDILTDTRYKDCRPKTRDNTHTSIVVYLINPFISAATASGKAAGGSRSEASEECASTLALIMCYQELLESLPENLRKQTYLEIVPLHAVLAGSSSSPDQQVLRSMAFSVYSKIAKKYTYQPLGQTMTGFGPVADAAPLEKTDSSCYVSLPPYILAPVSDHVNADGDTLEDKARVLFCAYCLSEDQRWLLASTVHDNGELMDTTVINIHVPNHSRRKKASVLRHGIQKLFEYLIVCMSKSLVKWRLVIGRFGRLGHGELKEWSKLLSKRSLLRACSKIREGCGMCASTDSERQMGILGACLISIEAHASFSILYNETSNKEDKKNNASPLNTPQDASVTHILIIPNSTTAGGNHSQNEAQIDPFSGDMPGDSEILQNFDLGDDIDLGDIFGMVSTIGNDGSPPHSPMNNSSMFGIPGGITSRRGTVTSMMDGGGGEDQVNLLQQPLAMGYIISTAPMGKLPAWFHSTAPHTENMCPAVLKSALHFHTVCSQQIQDDYNQMTAPNSQKASAHPLDSTTTCDVLRFVLDSYNRLSWLTVDPVTNDRASCLPVHINALIQLYHALNTFL